MMKQETSQDAVLRLQLPNIKIEKECEDLAFKTEESTQDPVNSLQLPDIKVEKGCDQYIIQFIQSSSNEEDVIKQEPEQDFELALENPVPEVKTKKPRKSNLTPKIECSKCESFFQDQESLKTHECKKVVPYKPPEINAFKCYLCGKRMRYKTAMQCHAVEHIEKDKISCRVCKGTMQESCINTHEDIYYEVSNTHQCDYCPKTFNMLCKLERHKQKHVKICRICQETFKNTREFNHHKLEHRSPYLFRCKFCKKKFEKSKAMREHLRVEHYEESE